MKNILSILLFLVTTNISAQEIDLKTKLDKPKRTLDLTFRIDRTNGSVGDVNMDYSYQGEFDNSANFDEYYYYYYGGGNVDPFDAWRWNDTTVTQNDWSDVYNIRNIKIDFLLSMTEHLNVGFSYNFLYFREDFDDNIDGTNNPYFMRGSGSTIVFATLGPTVEYEFELPFAKGLEITPGMTFGSYQSSRGLEGAGREFYFDGRLALEYVLWNRLGLRAFAAYDKWGYREKETSKIYRDREREVKTDWNMLQTGFGISYRFKLRPE